MTHKTTLAELTTIFNTALGDHDDSCKYNTSKRVSDCECQVSGADLIETFMSAVADYEAALCEHAEASWHMVVYVDIEAAHAGYDGDEPLPSDREWTPYLLVTYSDCFDCKHDADEAYDSLGSVWLADGEPKDDIVRQYAKDYGMLPEGASYDDMSIDYDF